MPKIIAVPFIALAALLLPVSVRPANAESSARGYSYSYPNSNYYGYQSYAPYSDYGNGYYNNGYYNNGYYYDGNNRRYWRERRRREHEWREHEWREHERREHERREYRWDRRW